MKTFTTKTNSKYNGIEIYFEGVPSESVRDILKENGFRWHSVKKCWYAKNTAKATACIDSLGGADPNTAAKAPAVPVNKYGIKVGDVFSASWGYEQTNVQFFQVIALKGSTMATFREIHRTSRSIGFCSDMVKPDVNNFIEGAEPFTRKINDYGSEPSCKGERDFIYMHLTDPDAEINATSYY